MRPVGVTMAVAVAAVLTLSACGSESRVQPRPAPKLPRPLATSLAARSDVLAAALRRGDGCAATVQLHGLERQTRLAIAAGRVPTVFRGRLLSAERQLATRLPRCVPPAPPPPPPPPPPPAHEGKKHKKHDDHPKPKKKHGKGKDH